MSLYDIFRIYFTHIGLLGVFMLRSVRQFAEDLELMLVTKTHPRHSMLNFGESSAKLTELTDKSRL